MVRNVGGWDRAIRIFAGVLALVAAFDVGGGAASWILALIAVIGLATGFSGYCLLYGLLHVSTHRTTVH